MDVGNLLKRLTNCGETQFDLTNFEIGASLNIRDEIKSRLNLVKAKTTPFKKLEREEWSKHTAKCDIMGRTSWELKKIYDLPFCSKAFMKCMECLSRLRPYFEQRDTEVRAIHLCEAPGAFILAFNYFLGNSELSKDGSYKWFMNTLKQASNSTALGDDFGIIESFPERMLYGADGTGNLLNFDEAYIKKIAEGGKFDIVTADGSFDCTDDPANQEMTVYPLIAKEVEVAMGLLKDNGVLIIKFYTFFEVETVTLIHKMRSHFKQITAVKPISSKASNSEVYLICQGYCSCHINIDRESYINTVKKASEYFMEHQVAGIELNRETFPVRHSTSIYKTINDLRRKQMHNFCIQYMTPINL